MLPILVTVGAPHAAPTLQMADVVVPSGMPTRLPPRPSPVRWCPSSVASRGRCQRVVVCAPPISAHSVHQWVRSEVVGLQNVHASHHDNSGIQSGWVDWDGGMGGKEGRRLHWLCVCPDAARRTAGAARGGQSLDASNVPVAMMTKFDADPAAHVRGGNIPAEMMSAFQTGPGADLPDSEGVCLENGMEGVACLPPPFNGGHSNSI